MSPPTPDPELARIALETWEAAAHGDRERLAELLDPDLVWHASGRGRWSGPRHGVNSVLDYLGALGEAADEFSSELEDVLVSERMAAVLFHVSGSRGERSLETDFILLFEIREGRVQRLWSIPRDQLAVDEFWA